MSVATVSASMIVRDEQEQLPTCLRSIRDVCSEIIVVVDTRTTDRTAEVAEFYGAKVYYRDWTNFSDQRNYSISKCAGDWILVIDADEEAIPADFAILEHLLQADGIDGIMAAVLNFTKRGVSKHDDLRLWRSGKVTYADIVHNQPDFTGNKVARGIRIYHHGYNLDRGKMTQKRSNTAGLLLRQITENPENIRAWRNLIRVYRAQGRNSEVITTGNSLLERKGELNFNMLAELSITSDLTGAYIDTGDYKSAIDVSLELQKVYPDHIDTAFHLAYGYGAINEHEKAIEMYQRYMDLLAGYKEKPTQVNSVVHTWGSVSSAFNNMSASYMALGDYDKAIECYDKAVVLEYKDQAERQIKAHQSLVRDIQDGWKHYPLRSE